MKSKNNDSRVEIFVVISGDAGSGGGSGAILSCSNKWASKNVEKREPTSSTHSVWNIVFNYRQIGEHCTNEVVDKLLLDLSVAGWKSSTTTSITIDLEHLPDNLNTDSILTSLADWLVASVPSVLSLPPFPLPPAAPSSFSFSSVSVLLTSLLHSRANSASYLASLLRITRLSLQIVIDGSNSFSIGCRSTKTIAG